MFLSFNSFQKERDLVQNEKNEDEDVEDDMTIQDMIQSVQPDILEQEEIRLTNISKAFTDSASKATLLYSRELLTISKEVQGVEFKRRDNQPTLWLRFEIYQKNDVIVINVTSSNQEEFDFFY